jgi:tetraacyldisaccharide 4'-kinase
MIEFFQALGSFFIQWASAIRRALYGLGLKRAAHAKVPVVSIGNLSFGGSGKTPVVLALAQALAKRGIKAVVLTRGYGRRYDQPTQLVAPEADWQTVGDEPLFMAQHGAVVVVDADRARAAAWALEKCTPDLFILDDGFSHLRLARDLDWLIVAPGDLRWFARRRELRRQKKRAHLLTSFSSGIGEQLQRRATQLLSITAEARTPAPLAALQNARVVAMCAIASPERFSETLKGLGAQVVAERFFHDHHPLPEAAFASLPPHDFVVITEKDAVKRPRWPANVRVLQSEAVLPEKLVDVVAALVRRPVMPASVKS